MTQSLERKSNFALDTLKLVGGTTFAQVVGTLLAPIFARIFAPEAFGMAAVFASLVGTIQVIAGLRYELTIMLPETDEEAANLFALTIGVVSIFSLIMAIVIWLGDTWIVRLLKTPELLSYLWLAPLALFVNGLSLAFYFWCTRTKQFGRLSISQITNSFVALGSRLSVGLAGYISGGTIINTTILGSIAAMFVLGGQIWREDGKRIWAGVSWSGMWSGAKRHYKFPVYNTWASLLNTLSWQLPVFVLTYFFSPAVVGFYALGNRIIRMPMSLIGNSIAQVFYQRAAAAATGDSLAPIVESVFSSLVSLSFFPMMILAIVGDDLFRLFLGPEWVEAGVYSQILAAWTFFWFISSPLSSLYNVHEKQEGLLGLQAVIFLSRLASLIIGGWLGSPRLCLALFGISGAIVYGYLSFSILVSSGVSLRASLYVIGYNLILFLPVGGILVGLKMIAASAWITISVATISYGIYLIYLVRTDEKIQRLYQQLNPFIKRFMPNHA